MATVTYNKLVIDCTDKGEIKGTLIKSTGGQEVAVGKEEVNAKMTLMASQAGSTVKDLATSGKVIMTDAVKKKYAVDTNGYLVKKSLGKTIVSGIKGNWKKALALIAAAGIGFGGGIAYMKYKGSADSRQAAYFTGYEPTYSDSFDGESYPAYDTPDGGYIDGGEEYEAYRTPRK